MNEYQVQIPSANSPEGQADDLSDCIRLGRVPTENNNNNVRAESHVLFGAKWGYSLGDGILDSSEKLL